MPNTRRYTYTYDIRLCRRQLCNTLQATTNRLNNNNNIRYTCGVTNKLCREKTRSKRDAGSVYFDLNFTLEVLTFYETYKKKNYEFLTIINTRLLHNNNVHAVGAIPVQLYYNILHRSHAQTLKHRVYNIYIYI